MNIKSKIRIFNKVFPIYFSLADRSKMTYKILLGRKILNKKFLVDVSQKDLSINQKGLS
ncbi:RimK/LysX family protein [Candidatus Kapabacteria bacterium]|nr:RimK/LysX family protein [Candidatus Kapabacteria bacterium]